MSGRAYPVPGEGATAPSVPPRPTMRDVARAAGVSVALVSHAYNRPARVAPTTRERILQTAVALGYPGPDPAARALRTGRVARIGVAAPGGVGDLLADQAAVLTLRGVARTCDRAGVAMTISSSFAEPVASVVTIRSRPELPPGVRRVSVDGDVDDDDDVGVRPDYRIGAAQLVELLRGTGHRQVVAVTGPDTAPRLRAFAAAWGRDGLRVLAAAGGSYGHGDIAARTVLASEPAATAIVALCDPLARGILDALRWAGRPVPEEVSVASFDDLPGSDAVGLTAVVVPHEPLGELAGSLALGTGGAPPPPLPTTLAVRATCGPARSIAPPRGPHRRARRPDGIDPET